MRYTCKVCGYIWDSRPADAKVDCPACERKGAQAIVATMRTHTADDRYRHYQDEGGWQIRYGPAEEDGECVGHIHDKAHAEIICTAVNILLESKQLLDKPKAH